MIKYGWKRYRRRFTFWKGDIQAKDKREDLEINLETEFSKANGGQYRLVQIGEEEKNQVWRSCVKILEAYLGQGSESGSWYLSFEDL